MRREGRERMKEETHHTGERMPGPRVLGIYTLYSQDPSRIFPRSPLTLSAEVLYVVGREEEERRDSTMLREDRETLSFPFHPFTDAFQRHRNPKASSLFLASQACENSTVQDAIGIRRVVEDVQETS